MMMESSGRGPWKATLAVLVFFFGVALVTSLRGVLPPKYATLVIALACDASFTWAAVRFFRRDGEGILPPQRRALHVTLGTAVLHGLALIYMYHGSRYRFYASVGLYVLALMLFWSTVAAALGHRLRLFFSTESSGSLIERGPYRAIRHPFYASYTLAWLAGAVATGQPLLLLSAALNLALYHRAAMLEEAQFDDSSLASRYRDYRERTGMFWPRLGRAASPRPAHVAPHRVLPRRRAGARA